MISASSRLLLLGIVDENEVYFLEILVLDLFEYVDEVLHSSLWELP
jgi:hypothetical protein